MHKQLLFESTLIWLTDTGISYKQKITKKLEELHLSKL